MAMLLLDVTDRFMMMMVMSMIPMDWNVYGRMEFTSDHDWSHDLILHAEEEILAA